jgi:hypothetical protein
MPNWKKVIVSGSIAHLSHVSSSGDFKTDKTGSFGRVETDAFSATTFTSTTVESTTISGSATSTGSFGRVETVGNSNLSGQLDVGGKVLLSREPIQGFNYLARQAEGEVSASIKAHTFTATAATKSSNHPYKNLGSGNGYIIDGVETPFLYLTEGYYKFDYSGATSHPIRFYFDAAKTTQYNPASHVSVDGNVITLKIDKDSPQIIYYQCSSHGYMGWAIHTGQNPLGQDENGLRTLFSGSAQVDIHNTTGYVANENIDHSGVTLSAGTGLTGGGDITANRSFAVDFGDSTLQTHISGSFTQASSSISTRLTTAESELSNTLVSSSAQLATDISGSFTDVSSSLSTRTTTLEGASATTGSNHFKDDQIISGSLTVTDTIIAQEFKTEFVSASITFTSGSTKFGDSIDDNHNMTGSLKISGSITADSFVGILSQSAQIASDISGSLSSTAIASLGASIVSSSAQLATDISGSIRSELSGSHIKFIGGGVSGSSLSTGSFGKLFGDASDLSNLPSAAITNYSSTGDNRIITSVNATNVQGEANLTFDGTSLTLTGQLTSSGDISGSSTSTGSFGVIEVGGGHFTSASLAAGGSGGGDSSVDAGAVSGSFRGLLSGSLVKDVGGGVSGSISSTGSFGRVEATRFVGDGSGLSNVAASITVKEEGSNLTTELSSIDFVGDGITASTSGNNVTVTQALTSGAGDAATITVSDASATWAVTHSLENKYPTVTIWDENDQVIIPSSITADTVDTATIRFEQAVSGRASFTLGIPTSSFFVSSSNQILTAVADSTISGDLNVTGTLTAQEFHTEVTSASIVFTSGSTIFGDSSDDIHNMTGSLNISGSLTLNDGDLTVTDNVDFNGDLDVDGTTNLDVVDIDGAVDMASNLTIAGNVTGSSTSTGSFGEVRVGGMSLKSLTTFSSSVATKLNSLDADIIALSIALG